MPYDFNYMYFKKKLINKAKQKQTHKCREVMVDRGWKWGDE